MAFDEQTWRVEQIRWERAWTRADRHPDTLVQYIRDTDKYLRWCAGGSKNTTDLASADLYVDHVQRSMGTHPARHAGRGIKAYGKFLAQEYDESDPFRRLKLPPEPAPSAKHAAMATDEDLERLLATCDQSTLLGARDYAMILMLAATGMRRGEVVALSIGDVDMVGQTLRVREGKTEAARRTVYMPESLQGALLRYLRLRQTKIEQEQRRYSGSVWLENLNDALWVTHTVGHPTLTANGLAQILRKKGKAVGVEVRAHAFRRRYAGQWMAKGGSETHLMTQAGWKSTAMIGHYTRDTKEKNSMSEAQRLFD